MLPSFTAPQTVHRQPRSTRPTMVRRGLAVLAGIALVGGASACFGSGTSGAEPSASVDPHQVAASVQASDRTSASASASLSPQEAELKATALAMEAPEKPAKMSENSPEGAVAAAEYFISLYPYVYATGDLTEWDAMCAPDTEVCVSVHDIVTDLHEDGGWGDVWQQEITKREINTSTGNIKAVAVRFNINSGQIVRHYSDGTTRIDPEDPEAIFEALMAWTDGAWQVTQGGFQ